MLVDICISAALAILTIAMAYLGVHVTLHHTEDPKKVWMYKVGFRACAAGAVILVVWQGVRNGKAQNLFMANIGYLNHQVKGLQSDLSTTKQQVADSRKELADESIRRQQSEKDLEIIVQASGKSTREGVVTDIKQSPIKVEMNGQPIADPAKTTATRNKLGELLEQNETIKNSCLIIPVPIGFSCTNATNIWLQEALQYISHNMEASYRARFVSATGYTSTWSADGKPVDAESNASINQLAFKAAVLTDFIKEQH